MSSVFLYVAIVAIWAFVLVPRWLRHHHAQPEHDADDFYRTDSIPEHDADDLDETGIVPEPSAEVIETEVRLPREHARPAGAVARGTYLAPQPRPRMMLARRRLLTVLVVLTAAAGACAGLKVAPWWACVPPAGVLCIYVLLLREASRADAERVQIRGAEARDARLRATARLRAEAAARAPAIVGAPDTEPSAEIIDISARRGDQLYD